MPTDLYSLAEREGVIIEWWDFKPPLEAVYWSTPNFPPIIGLSTSLERESKRYFRCVLAEELGHHFTTTINAIPKTFFHYRDRLEISKAEYKALKWAAQYLIPRDELLRAFKRGITERWDLAEWFNVTEEMIDFRLKLPDMTQARKTTTGVELWLT